MSSSSNSALMGCVETGDVYTQPWRQEKKVAEKGLGVEPLLLHIKMTMIPPGCLLEEVFGTCSTAEVIFFSWLCSPSRRVRGRHQGQGLDVY